MGGMAKQFSDPELKAMARYIASLPGEVRTVPQSRFSAERAPLASAKPAFGAGPGIRVFMAPEDVTGQPPVAIINQ